jgi:hypothetical protein
MHGDATTRTTADETTRLLTAAGWTIERREAQTTESIYLVCDRGAQHVCIRISGHTRPGYSRMRRNGDTWETFPRFPASLRKWLAKLI